MQLDELIPVAAPTSPPEMAAMGQGCIVHPHNAHVPRTVQPATVKRVPDAVIRPPQEMILSEFAHAVLRHLVRMLKYKSCEEILPGTKGLMIVNVTVSEDTISTKTLETEAHKAAVALSEKINALRWNAFMDPPERNSKEWTYSVRDCESKVSVRTSRFWSWTNTTFPILIEVCGMCTIPEAQVKRMKRG